MRNPTFSIVSMVIVVGTAILVGILGCSETNSQYSHDLPAPLRSDFPYELRFDKARVWEAACFEINLEGIMHRITLAGVSAPRIDHPYHSHSVDSLRDLVGSSKGRIVVVGRDQYQRELGYVFVMLDANQELGNEGIESKADQTDELVESDVGLRLIEMGLVGHNATEFERAPRYRRSEKRAIDEQIGIWEKTSADNSLQESRQTD